MTQMNVMNNTTVSEGNDEYIVHAYCYDYLIYKYDDWFFVFLLFYAFDDLPFLPTEEEAVCIVLYQMGQSLVLD